MTWRVVIRPEVEHDVADAAAWYEARQSGLGLAFVEDVIKVWDDLAINPLLNSRRPYPEKDIRWRLTNRFPFRVVYAVTEANQTVVVACVVHAARHDRLWQHRV